MDVTITNITRTSHSVSMHRRTLPILAALLTALSCTASTVGCDGRTVSLGTSADAAPAALDGPTALPGDAAAPVVNERSGAFTLNVKNPNPSLPLAPGRLVVVWGRFEDPAAPSLVAYDVPFEPSVTTYAVPDGAVAAPTYAQIYCERPCSDRDVCDCNATTTYRVATAYVLVVDDTNGDGHITNDELDAKAIRGAGQLAVFYTDRLVAPGGPGAAILVDPVPEGIGPLRLVPQPVGKSRLGLPAGNAFDLQVCAPSDASCHPPVPSLG